MTVLTTRRSFLAGLFVAPAIIPAAKLMKVKVWVEPPHRFVMRTSLPQGKWRDLYRNELIRDMINPPMIVDNVVYRPLWDSPNVLLERLRIIDAACIEPDMVADLEACSNYIGAV